jgi:hypothetical protein
VSEGEKNHFTNTRHTHNTCVQPHVSLGGKRWARRGGMAMVQDTQGNGESARRSAESPLAPHACYGRKHFSPACAGVMCV